MSRLSPPGLLLVALGAGGILALAGCSGSKSPVDTGDTGDSGTVDSGDTDSADSGDTDSGDTDESGDTDDSSVPVPADDIRPGEVVITEILADPIGVSDEAGEWFEVTNVSTYTRDLEGLVVSDGDRGGFTVAGPLPLAPNARLVFGVQADSSLNGGVTLSYTYTDLTLGNATGTLILSNAGGLLDEVDWDSVNGFPVGGGASLSLDPTLTNTTSNDAGVNWCNATTPMADGDFGTPGAVNDECGEEPPPTDLDGDGYDAPADCDDDDPTVYPGASDLTHDGVDQDCDGTDGLPDVDGDGYDTSVDCNDDDASIHPGAVDTNGDHIDQDCDGADGVPATGGADDLAPGDLIIAEIMVQPDAVPDGNGEWFEVINLTGIDIDLNGLDVTASSGAGFTITTATPVSVGQSFVFATDGDTRRNGGVTADYDYGSISLVDDVGYVAIANSLGLLDEVAWDATFPTTRGASMALDPGCLDAIGNDSGTCWCAGASAYGDGDLGTPGAANPVCTTTYPDLDGDGYTSDVDCDDGDRAINPTAYDVPGDGIDQDCDGADDTRAPGAIGPGDLVITEVMVNPTAVDDLSGEWVELYNATSSSLDLDGLVISDGTATAAVTGSLVVASHGYVVLGSSTDIAANGGATVDYAYRGLTFANAIGSVSVTWDTTLVDEVAWDGAVTFPSPVGGSIMLDPAYTDATSNDDGASWCASFTSFGDGDLGTPDSANPSCPVDADADGYDSSVDCDDSNPGIHPLASDLSGDGIDQDCDGIDG